MADRLVVVVDVGNNAILPHYNLIITVYNVGDHKYIGRQITVLTDNTTIV
jgi:hypothetical protein